ncbi:MAG: FxsA family protein [Actinomycetota bacterium]
MAPARRLTRGGRRRPRLAWIVFVALLVVPVAEIAVIVAVGTVIGGWQTLALLLVESALGAYLVKREGRRSWQGLRTALNTGKMPGRELADAALVLIGGTLLLTPGFLTDLVGFFFILPATRPITRKWLQDVVERRLIPRSGIIRGEVI